MKKFVLGIIALACISAQAEYSPEGKTIKVVLPQGPASGMAMIYRYIENYAAKNKINMVPVFKPGAESKIGLQYYVATQDKTGDTLLLSATSDVVEQNFPTHLEAVTSVIGISPVLVASKKSGIKSTKDIAAIEKNSPGKLNWAVSNSVQTSILYTVAESLGADKKKLAKVSYPAGGGHSQSNIMSGDIDLAWFPKTTAEKLSSTGHVHMVELDAATISALERKQNVSAIFLPRGASNDAIKYWEEFIVKFHEDMESAENMRANGVPAILGRDQLVKYINNWSE